MKNFWIGAVCVGGSFLGANPLEPEVLAGRASFEGDLRVVAEDRTVIGWKEFSIGADERVEFVLPGRECAVLNRVREAEPSRLMGRLESNGRVILVNPNGVLVGKGGVVDTGSFVASSLEVQNRLFVEKGELACREISWGMVVNEGVIRGDEVLLMGFEVQNGGRIEGREVVLAGAKEVWVEEGFVVRVEAREGLREAIEREGNVYAAAFKHPEDLDWPELVELEDVEAMRMPGPCAVQRGEVSGESVWILGDYVDVRKGSRVEGEEVWAEASRLGRFEGVGVGERVVVWGENGLVFTGEVEGADAQVYSPGYFVNKGVVRDHYTQSD